MTNSIPLHSEDKYLVDKVLSGDKSAFTTIIRQTEGLVAQMVFKMIPRTDDRKDIVQDVYLKAFRNLSGFRHQARLSTWIGQITYNTCISYLRTKKLLLPGDAADIGEDDHPAPPPETAAPDRTDLALFIKQRSAILQNALEVLTPVQKTLVSLYHQEEMSYQEIAVITGLPDGTVKNYLFRARKALREHLLLHYKKDEI